MALSSQQMKDYLKKIGFKGKLSVSLECLTQIVEGHAFTFPFETIDSHDSDLDLFPQRRTSLNVNTLFRKLVNLGRGGNCVELNVLLIAMLKSLRFQVMPIVGDDLWMSSHLSRNNRPKHAAAIVNVDGQDLLIDAAFGGIGIMLPISLKKGESQQYSEKFRVIAGKEYAFELQAFHKNQWKSLYGFNNVKATGKQLEALNHSSANVLTAKSPFKNYFSCTKPFKMKNNENGRYNLCNEKFVIRENNKVVHREIIDNQAKLHAILKKFFAIDLSTHYLRYDEVAMQAYQVGIHYPPTLHNYNTRLKKKYLEIKKSVKDDVVAKKVNSPVVAKNRA